MNELYCRLKERKPVYVYHDLGVSEIGAKSLLLAVETHLHRPVKFICAEQIITGMLAEGAMLIMPGGADLPYCAKLDGEGNRQIKHFIGRGGIYVGICAGAYYGCAALDFIGRDYVVSGYRELALFNGIAQGCLPQWTDGQRYDEGTSSKAIIPLRLSNGHSAPFYYHGGCCFKPYPSADYEAIAYYPDGELAIIGGRFGNGEYLLSGVHFELQAAIYQQNLAKISDNLPEKMKELAISTYFDEKYGAYIWQYLQKRLKYHDEN